MSLAKLTVLEKTKPCQIDRRFFSQNPNSVTIWKELQEIVLL